MVEIDPRLSLKEVARQTSLSRATIYRAIKSGALSARRLGNRRTVVAASDLRAFLERCETPIDNSGCAVDSAHAATKVARDLLSPAKRQRASKQRAT